jgi:PAS domain S-box-containing protein
MRMAEQPAVSEGSLPMGTAASRPVPHEPNEDKGGEPHFIVKKTSEGFALEAFNCAFAEAFARAGQAVRMKPIQDVLLPSIAKAVISRLRMCVATQQPARFEVAPRRGHQWELTLVPLKTGGNRFEIVGQASEIAARPAGQAHTKLDRDMLERLAATSHDILYLFDPRRKKLLYVNERIRSVLGYDVEELLGRERSPLRHLIHPADLPLVREHFTQLEHLADAETRSVEYRVRRADGHYAWLRSSDTVLQRDAKGDVSEIIGSAIDVTDNRHLVEDLKRISSRLLESQNEERRRIARELHDSTAQHLVALSVGLARLDSLSRRDCPASDDQSELIMTLNELRQVAREAQQEIRTLSYLLHPPVLESMGLAESLRKFLTGFGRRTGIRTRLTVSDTFSCGSHGISTALMRIAQEALINVFRHAKASEVRVTLTNRGRETVLEVVDDGKGMSPAVVSGSQEAELGVGVPGMRARVQQFRGDLQITSGANGTKIRASIPDRAAPPEFRTRELLSSHGA